MQYELEYDVLAADTRSDLILAVRSRILLGWVPVGGMIVGTDNICYQTSAKWKTVNTYYQTMTHERRLPGT